MVQGLEAAEAAVKSSNRRAGKASRGQRKHTTSGCGGTGGGGTGDGGTGGGGTGDGGTGGGGTGGGGTGGGGTGGGGTGGGGTGDGGTGDGFMVVVALVVVALVVAGTGDGFIGGGGTGGGGTGGGGTGGGGTGGGGTGGGGTCGGGTGGADRVSTRRKRGSNQGRHDGGASSNDKRDPKQREKAELVTRDSKTRLESTMKVAISAADKSVSSSDAVHPPNQQKHLQQDRPIRPKEQTQRHNTQQRQPGKAGQRPRLKGRTHGATRDASD